MNTAVRGPNALAAHQYWVFQNDTRTIEMAGGERLPVLENGTKLWAVGMQPLGGTWTTISVLR